MSLADENPSHLLRDIKELAGIGLENPVLKSLRQQHRLPSQSLTILADKVSRPNDVYLIPSNAVERSSLDRIDALGRKDGKTSPIYESRSRSKSKPTNYGASILANSISDE